MKAVVPTKKIFIKIILNSLNKDSVVFEQELSLGTFERLFYV